MIERYGLDGWLVMVGAEEPSPLLPEALAIVDGELERLEHEDRVAEARRERERRDARR